MPKLLPKAYEPKAYEASLYRLWERGKFFTPRVARGKTPFTTIMPPPNANGDLHIGHALFVSLEDIMTRYHRLKDEPTLWLPGADHAGFETQVVFERKLEKEGRSRLRMTREEFYREVWNFTLKNKKNMESQLRSLGASCDWSRNTFTLDPKIIQIVYHTFKRLYDDGLIYRGERLVNYCTYHQTSFSDLEVQYVERKDPLYYITYGPFTLATVRPETKFGDTAVAVHPKDPRYQKYIGREIEIEDVLGNATLKVIADEAVDPEFGTGVIKVTPAHDMTDWEIGLRHGLEIKQVIGKDGRLNKNAGPYAGLTVEEARKRVVENLKKKGLIEKTDEHYTHKVGVCYKCGTVIEPMILPQWFLKTKPLAKPAIDAVTKGKIRIVPKYFEKIYFHWLRTIKDWNISRQIWWGIPIPAYFCDSCGTVMVNIKGRPKECSSCGSTKIRQDPDTFDTWFSSGQWPFATLLSHGKRRLPKSASPLKLDFTTDDYGYFYPTSVMETGYEILFFWVARMVMLGLYMTGEIPFRTIYLHGTVRDRYKRKISKSLGNVVNPLELIGLYGADALRMGLVVGNTPGRDLSLAEDKVKGYRNFANKLWNVSRFILMSLDGKRIPKKVLPKTKEDRWILTEEEKTIKAMTRLMDTFRFYQAGEVIYHYLWHAIADKYLETSKRQLQDPKLSASTQAILARILRNALVMLHPFMPFVTEAIWQEWEGTPRKPLIVEKWPIA